MKRLPIKMTNLTVRYQMCGAVEGGYNMVRLILVWGVASLVNIVAERLEREREREWPPRSPLGLG